MHWPRSDRRARYAGGLALLAALALPIVSAPTHDDLLDGFQHPPPAARMRCYWWWLNGNTNQATITRDLEQMKSKGYGGALLVDADGSGQQGNEETPAGPMFGSPPWRALYLHALREAARLDLEISLNIQSGWNLGGPAVTPEQGAKLLTWSRVTVEGPAEVKQDLPQPASRLGYYRDIAVLAYPLRHGVALPGSAGGRRSIRQLAIKNASMEFGMSMPKTAALLDDFPATSGEEDTAVSDVRDVSDRMNASGQFRWMAPEGKWEILRVGYTASGARVSTSSLTWQGLAIDYLDRAALEVYWKQNVDPILEAARPYLGRSLKYLVTDSWELGGINWTGAFRGEFRAARGYDLLPYLPVVAGRIVESRGSSNRFLNDFRRTVADLIVSQHYRPFAEMAARYGLGIHPESGGPHGAPLDALQTLGVSAFPQTEYWAPSQTHRTRDDERFFVKECSSAAHIYGKTIAAAEGMTSIGPHWEETPASLQPAFDQAVTEGLNRLVWHTFTSSPKEMGLPGQEYFAGTHLNPNVTWWREADAFIAYLNRVQFLMQQGIPVSDVLYYYGDQAPNFVQLKAADPAKVLPGYDYDVTDEEALISRFSVRSGAIVLPEGTAYRLLALPDSPSISPSAIRAVRKLVADGAAVAGRKPERATGRIGDDEVRAIAAEVWGDCGENGVKQHRFGSGVVYCQPAREALGDQKVAPDFEGAGLDYLHRQVGGAHVYFIRNTRPEAVTEDVVLRAQPGLAPELWHAETGTTEALAVYDVTADGRTRIPLRLEANDSAVVVFRRAVGPHVVRMEGPDATVRIAPDGSAAVETAASGTFTATMSTGAVLVARASAAATTLQVAGPWTVEFTPGWGAPPKIAMERLQSWTQSADAGVKYYSGTAKYTAGFQLPEALNASQSLELDLGEVKEIARVWVNGHDLGVQWKKPFRVELGTTAHAGWNDLAVEVTNLWPNRLIGDRLLPPEKRVTRTNILKFTAHSPLTPSGLLGPVTIQAKQIVRLAARP